MARALCLHDGYDPDDKDSGMYTLPYDAKWIGDENTHCDGRGRDGQKDGYKEPWSYLWRRYGASAMVAIRAIP